MRTHDLVLIALFAALISVGSYISIPTPSMPITLQTMMVFLTGLVLGGKRAAFALMLYMFIGLAGLPVFSNMQGGIGFVFRPSFGFVIGFIPAAFVIGHISRRGTSILRMAIACVCGMLVLYSVGVPYMYMILKNVMSIDIAWVLINGMLIYMPGEAVKIAAAVVIGKHLRKALSRA